MGKKPAFEPDHMSSVPAWDPHAEEKNQLPCCPLAPTCALEHTHLILAKYKHVDKNLKQ